jgi:DNA-binding response OmpR family regulator
VTTRIKPRVVIVDDDPDVVDRVIQVLEDDFDVKATTDWGELSRLVFRAGCELVLMDVNLPVLRGDTLVKILRKSQTAGGAPTRIFFFSAADPDLIERLVHETGADGWISKSLRGKELLAEVWRQVTPRATR